jgi:L-seryl-tRNA(Ser) seleniumtransferase
MKSGAFDRDDERRQVVWRAAGGLSSARRIIDRSVRSRSARRTAWTHFRRAGGDAGLYREPARAIREIPALAQLTADIATLKQRADRLAAAIGDPRVSVVETVSSVGGGAFPTATILSAALRVNAPAEKVERRLRGATRRSWRASPKGWCLDLRTVFVTDEEELAARGSRRARGGLHVEPRVRRRVPRP